MASCPTSTELRLKKLDYAERSKYFLSKIDSKSNINLQKESEKNLAHEHTIAPAMSIVLCLFLVEACDQIYILGGFDSSDKVREPCKFDSFNTIVETFQGVCDPIFDKDSSEPFRIAFNKRKAKKMTNDSLFITDVLASLRNELMTSKTYTGFVDLMQELHILTHDETALTNEKLAHWYQMLDLKSSLAIDDIEGIEKLQSLSNEIAVMRDQIEDIYFENIIRKRYIENWEAARENQNRDIYVQAEDELNDTITTYKAEIEKEMRVHAEIVSFLKENEIEINGNIDHWQTLYDKEIEEREISMQVLRDKREYQENDLLELKGMYELRRKQINEYLIHKEKKRIEDERQAFLAGKATKIQAWWRGLMFRLKLGPYNPNKGKKGKKGKGSGKKK